MNPALSLVFFIITLAGAAQGLGLALFSAEWATRHQWLGAAPDVRLHVVGALVAALLASADLAASFLHLGRPERAWRAATMRRTSWLSHEVIVLPGFIALALAYAAARWLRREESLVIGALASLAAIMLFVCTGMIYACIRFLREWATPLTPVNFGLLGCANGYTLAAVIAAPTAPGLLRFLLVGAMCFTLAGLLGRLAERWLFFAEANHPQNLYYQRLA